jgi:uncharacterized membrane protein YdjX (TVP38/TMEM64 family)
MFDDSGSGSASTRVFASARARRRTLGVLAALVGAVALGTLAVATYAPFLSDPAWLRATIAATGPLAPAVFVAVQTLQVVVAPVPGQVLGFVGGYLFGTAAGAVYSLLGVTLGSAVVFVLARRFGRPYVERAVDADALARFDGFVAEHGRAGLFVAFLLPTFPDDLLCVLAGLSEIRLRTLVALVVVGRAPSFLAVAAAGGSAASADYRAATALLTGLALLTLVVYYGRDRFAAAVGRLGRQ